MAAAFGAGLVAFAASTSFTFSVALMFGIGFAAAGIDTLGQTMLQRAADDHERGAAMGVWLFTIGFGPLGLVVLGAAAVALGAPAAQAASGLLLLVGSVGIIRARWLSTTATSSNAP
jgi:hypothetical protein